MLLLAETLKDPDEIWQEFVFNKKTQKYYADRRYLARFKIAGHGKARDAVVAFEYRAGSWYGSTGFLLDGAAATKKRRHGKLIYRKGQK